MTYASILNTLGSYERQFGAATLHACAAARRCSKHDPIAFDNLFSGDQASMNAAAYIVAPMTLLMGNDYEKVDVDGLDLTIATTEEPKTATLERVWLDDPRPRAGRTVPLEGAASARIAARKSSARCRSRFRPTPAARSRSWCPTARGSA